MFHVIRLAALICCLAVGLNSYPAEAKRVALVIGVGDHLHLPKLKNPVNDATDVAEALAKLDFQVTLKKDAGYGELLTALRDLSRESKGADAAVVFFAGNGVEVGGVNYLIPVDAKLTGAADLKLEAIALETVLAQLADAKLGLVILDACRDHPVRLTGDLTLRGGHRGIVSVVTAHNRFVLYAGEPGKTVQDGKGRNSPFTEALLKHLPTPGQELRHLIVRVRADVRAATGGTQVPTYYDNFDGEFVFKPAQ
jgi:uncharacterized caspase-like protein